MTATITECSLCPGKHCVTMESGRLENTNPPNIMTGAVDLAKIKMVAESIEDCGLRELQEWWELEGKTDEMNLGC